VRRVERMSGQLTSEEIRMRKQSGKS